MKHIGLEAYFLMRAGNVQNLLHITVSRNHTHMCSEVGKGQRGMNHNTAISFGGTTAVPWAV